MARVTEEKCSVLKFSTQLLPLHDQISTVPFVFTICLVAIGLGVAVWGLRRLAQTSAITNAALRALRVGGPMPEHVAFIMDGNRRWARGLGLPASQGHPRGGERLIDSMKWCLEAGIRTVTVFAFSIENFKRSCDEVNELMKLANDLFEKFSDQNHIIHQRHIRIRVLGDMTLISPELRQIFSRVMKETMTYEDGPTLNICFAYAARYDMASAVRDIAKLCSDGLLRPEEINEETVAGCLATGFGKGASAVRKPSPDLLVRTSGEMRLSDFLLWESSCTVLNFYPVLWPDFSAWDLVHILLDYQKVCHKRRQHYPFLNSKLEGSDAGPFSPDGNPQGMKTALLQIRKQYFSEIDQYITEDARMDTNSGTQHTSAA